MKKTLTFFFVFVCCLSAAYAVEIPLDNKGVISGGGSSSGTVVNIGFVDIEKIFAEHPMTARVQEEFKVEVEKRKKEISDLEDSVTQIRKVIISTTTEVSQAKAEIEALKKGELIPATTAPLQQETTVATGTGTVTQPQQQPAKPELSVTKSTSTAARIAILENEIKEKEAGIVTMNQDIAKKKEEIKLKIKENKEDLARLEEKKTTAVLNDLYHVLEKIALEENITIIIDKNNVLYGQPNQDLTAKVRERLQGR